MGGHLKIDMKKRENKKDNYSNITWEKYLRVYLGCFYSKILVLSRFEKYKILKSIIPSNHLVTEEIGLKLEILIVNRKG